MSERRSGSSFFLPCKHCAYCVDCSEKLQHCAIYRAPAMCRKHIYFPQFFSEHLTLNSTTNIILFNLLCKVQKARRVNRRRDRGAIPSFYVSHFLSLKEKRRVFRWSRILELSAYDFNVYVHYASCSLCKLRNLPYQRYPPITNLCMRIEKTSNLTLFFIHELPRPRSYPC